MLLTKLKNDLLTARKSKDKFTSSVLSFIIGDVELSMRRSGEKRDSDTITLATINKLIKDDRLIMSKTKVDSEDYSDALNEINYISSYLPTMLSPEEIKTEIEKLAPKNMPEAMQYFNKNFKGKVDNALLRKIVESYLK